MAVLFISGALAFRYTAREFAPEPARRLDESLWIQEQNAGTYTVASQSCDEGDASDPNAYFNRPFCVNEMRWGFAAIDDPDKPLKHIQPVEEKSPEIQIACALARTEVPLAGNSASIGRSSLNASREFAQLRLLTSL